MKHIFLLFWLLTSTEFMRACSEYILAGTIGKFETEIGLFSISTSHPDLIETIKATTSEIINFSDFILKTCQTFSQKHHVRITRACLGVSGNTQPSKDYIQSPHLSFPIDGKEIALHCNLQKVFVINDFEIIGYGLKAISADHLITLNKGKPREQGTKLILGAGAGLGSSAQIWEQGKNSYQIVPIYAAFTDFIPFTQQELDFAQFISKRNGKDSNVSWGYVLGSKGGIVAMYEYFSGITNHAYRTNPQAIFINRHNDEFCKKAVNFYMSIYTRLIRNITYIISPYGGLYLTNKVVINNSELFTDPNFLIELFNCHNETLKNIISDIPVYLVTDPQIGLYGAAGYLAEETQTISSASWIHPKLEVRKSNLDKLGVFAKDAIQQNEVLAIFGGKIITKNDVLALNPESRKNVLQIEDNFWIYSDVPDTLDHINHSCDPNAGIQGQIVLVAMRNINSDEEITFDYATVVSEWVGMDPISCNCGASDCRKIISHDDWKNPIIQKKYPGYFSEYLEEKIRIRNI